MSFVKLNLKEISNVAGGVPCQCNHNVITDGGLYGGWMFPENIKSAAECATACCSKPNYLDLRRWAYKEEQGECSSYVS